MLKCLLRMHEYEVLSTEEYKDVRDNVIGKVIVNRCKHCGKVSQIKVKTVEGIF